MLFIWIINGIIISLLATRAVSKNWHSLKKTLIAGILISVISGFTYTLLFNSDTNITDLLFKFRVQEVIYNIWIVMTFIVSIWVFKKLGY